MLGEAQPQASRADTVIRLAPASPGEAQPQASRAETAIRLAPASQGEPWS